MTAEQPAAVVPSKNHPGEALRKAREGRSMSLADVAGALHLPKTTLQNLESGAFDRMPGHTFTRGYIRAYAKLLGMDQELLVREFDQVTGSDANGSEVNCLGQIEEPARGSNGLLRLLSLAVLAALVLAGFLWWQGSSATRNEVEVSTGIQQVEVESADGTTQIHPLEPEDQAVELAQEAPSADQSAAVGSLGSTVAVAAGDTNEQAIASAPAIVETAPSAVPALSAPAPAPGVAASAEAGPEVVAPASAPPVSVQDEITAGPGEGLLVIRFSANCWTQVVDGNGKTLLSQLRGPGQDLRLAVKLPLELRLGLASAAQVTFNGMAVDTKPFLNGETARLKLGQ